MKKIALFLVAVVALFTACTEKTSDATLTVKPAELTIKVGETARIAVSVEPAGDYEFEWKSANESIATVENGIVTGVAKGETTIDVNIVGSKDVKTVKVAVVGELDAVKYWGAYPMLNQPEKTTFYTLKNEETGEEVPVSMYQLMFVPENFYVSAGSFAGGWDYPVFATTTVEDRRLLDPEEDDRNGFIYVWSMYQFAPAEKSVITDVNEAGDDIVAPYYFVSDEFNKENYEALLYELLVKGNKDESVYDQYPYFTDLSSYMDCFSFDDQANYTVGYPTGEGLVYIPGYPKGDEVYFADIAYNFDVKFFTNAEWYGLDLIPGVDEATGEAVMNFPVDDAGNPVIRMAEMTTHHFEGGSVEFPTEDAQVKRAGITNATAMKISDVNRMLFKSITYNRDFSKLR